MTTLLPLPIYLPSNPLIKKKKIPQKMLLQVYDGWFPNLALKKFPSEKSIYILGLWPRDYLGTWQSPKHYLESKALLKRLISLNPISPFILLTHILLQLIQWVFFFYVMKTPPKPGIDLVYLITNILRKFKARHWVGWYSKSICSILGELEKTNLTNLKPSSTKN